MWASGRGGSRLRGEGGCPWDREQTLNTLKPYLIEESYELIDAVDSGDLDRHREELGDVLLQVLLHSRIREEEGAFTFSDVAETLADKLIRRHPHVFGNVHADTPEAVLKNWEAIKSAETKDDDRCVIDGIPKHLPALQKAQRVQSRVARVGFDWPDIEGVWAKIEEEIQEAREAIASHDERRIEEELGDLLFSVVNLGRHKGVNAEAALQATAARFMDRFRRMEQRIRRSGGSLETCTPTELDREWEAVKAEDSD